MVVVDNNVQLYAIEQLLFDHARLHMDTFNYLTSLRKFGNRRDVPRPAVTRFQMQQHSNASHKRV